MKWVQPAIRNLVYVHYLTAGLLALMAFIAAFMEKPTPEDPTANAGFYGGLVVFCITSISIPEGLKSASSRREKCRVVGVKLGLLAGAYLLIAAAAGVSPSDLNFLAGFTVVWFLLAVVVLILFMLVSLSHWKAPRSDADGN